MYSVDIKIEETMLEDNRIYLKVLVNEGVRAEIKQIKTLEIKTYSDAQLTKFSNSFACMVYVLV